MADVNDSPVDTQSPPPSRREAAPRHLPIREANGEEKTTDVYSTEKRSAVMRRVKGKDTGPELAVRRILRRAGIGYRLGGCGLPGRPDVVMKGRRIAVFVHGCFWHGHDCARGARQPKANADYWLAKIGRNRDRDLRNTAALQAGGWSVVTVWECDMKGPKFADDLIARVKA